MDLNHVLPDEADHAFKILKQGYIQYTFFHIANIL
jgi:hypothetical protein